MMIQRKVRLKYNTLTDSEKVVAQFIIDNRERVRLMTTYDIAEELGIGQSTIIRFSKKLGYKSYRELLSEIGNQIEDKLPREEIKVKETTLETNEKIIAQYIDIANLTLQNNDPEVIDQVVELIYHAQKVICYGVGNSNLLAEYLNNQLVVMGINSIAGSNSHIVFSNIYNTNKDDLLILVSESGESSEILSAAKIAKKCGTKIVLLSKSNKNPLLTYADIILNTVKFEIENQLNARTIRCSQLCLIDMLSLNLMKKDYDRFEATCNESRDIIVSMGLRNK